MILAHITAALAKALPFVQSLPRQFRSAVQKVVGVGVEVGRLRREATRKYRGIGS